MKNASLVIIALCVAYTAQAQVFIQPGAAVHLQPRSQLIIEGGLEYHDDIGGEGQVIFKGQKNQLLDSRGHSLPDLVIDNAEGATLAAPLYIRGRLQLNAGKLRVGGHGLILDHKASIDGGSAYSYIETNGNGQVKKMVSANLSGYLVPLGNAEGYAPVWLNTDGRYNNAYISVGAISGASAHLPASTDSYLHQFWSVNRKGVTGTVQATARIGTVKDQDMVAHYWDGRSWHQKKEQNDTRLFTLTAVVPEGRGELSAFRTHAGRNIRVLPNPVVSVANVMIHSAAEAASELRVVDMYGRVVLIQKIRLMQGLNKVSLQLGHLAKGNYTVHSPALTKESVASFIRE